MAKILVVQQYFYPDISAVSQLLSDLLKLTSEISENDITVLCGNNVRNFEKEFSSAKDYPKNVGKVKIIRLKTVLSKGKVFIHRIFEYILFFCDVFFFLIRNKKQYDIYITMTTPPLIGFIVTLALGRIRRPLIVYVEDLYPELLFDMGYIKKYWIIKKLRFFNEIIFKNAEKIITLGPYMTKKLQNNYNIDLNKVTEISNWTDGIEYTPPERKDKFTLLYSGNLGLAHDFKLFPLLLEKIEEEDIEIKFCFVGGGRQFNWVKSLFEKTSLDYSFKNYTDRETHNNVLALADMFIISQKVETVGDILPSKFYSYIAAGRPMLYLGTEKSEIGSFISERQVGCILEIEDDISGIVEYITKLVEDKKKHIEICNCLNNININEMGLKKSAERFIRTIKEVDNGF